MEDRLCYICIAIKNNKDTILECGNPFCDTNKKKDKNKGEK